MLTQSQLNALKGAYLLESAEIEAAFAETRGYQGDVVEARGVVLDRADANYSDVRGLLTAIAWLSFEAQVIGQTDEYPDVAVDPDANPIVMRSTTIKGLIDDMKSKLLTLLGV